MRLFRAAAVVGTVLVLGAAGLAVRGHPDLHSDAPAQPPIAGVDTQLARVSLPEPRVLELVIGPVELPPRQEGILIPVQLVRVPVDVWLHGFSWSVVDGQGRELPAELLHHVNLIDPDRRELFGPAARRVVAAGRETSAFRTPSLLGYPLARGTRLLVTAMFANPFPDSVPHAELRVRLHFSPRPRRGPEPLAIFPFHMDVMGPVGIKSFPVPPGRTVKSWEGSPAADVRVLALGGHMHDHARLLLLEDVTTGRTLWRAVPERRASRVVGVPRAQPWRRGGLRLVRDHVYRVTVEYDNPTDTAIAHGGMGLVAGVVTGRAPWPPVDPADPDYAADLAGLIAAPRLTDAGHGHAH